MSAPTMNKAISPMPMMAPRASSLSMWPWKHDRSTHKRHVPSQMAAMKNVAA